MVRPCRVRPSITQWPVAVAIAMEQSALVRVGLALPHRGRSVTRNGTHAYDGAPSTRRVYSGRRCRTGSNARSAVLGDRGLLDLEHELRVGLGLPHLLQEQFQRLLGVE